MNTRTSLVSHLQTRSLDIALHKVWLDPVNNLATFPLYNLSGQLVGYQQYRPNGTKTRGNNPREGKYFTYRTKGELALWGLESLLDSECNEPIYVCEGIFDAARLTKMGLCAVATLSNNPKGLTEWLRVLSATRKIVVVCDSDQAGQALAKFASHPSLVFTCPTSHDLASVPFLFIAGMVHQVTYN